MKKKKLKTRLNLFLFKNKNDGGLFDLPNREVLFPSEYKLTLFLGITKDNYTPFGTCIWNL